MSRYCRLLRPFPHPPEVQAKLRLINEMGREKFAPRAKAIDDDASFPVENYRDLAAEGFLGLCIGGVRRLGLFHV